MAKISILGGGSWGIALAVLLHKNGHEITVWSALETEIEMLRQTHEHKMLPGVTLAEERDIFFIVTPSEQRVSIMQAIVKEAGLHTPAKAAVFSIPIQHLAGFPKYSGK